VFIVVCPEKFTVETGTSWPVDLLGILFIPIASMRAAELSKGIRV